MYHDNWTTTQEGTSDEEEDQEFHPSSPIITATTTTNDLGENSSLLFNPTSDHFSKKYDALIRSSSGWCYEPTCICCGESDYGCCPMSRWKLCALIVFLAFLVGSVVGVVLVDVVVPDMLEESFREAYLVVGDRSMPQFLLDPTPSIEWSIVSTLVINARVAINILSTDVMLYYSGVELARGTLPSIEISPSHRNVTFSLTGLQIEAALTTIGLFVTSFVDGKPIILDVLCYPTAEVLGLNYEFTFNKTLHLPTLPSSLFSIVAVNLSTTHTNLATLQCLSTNYIPWQFNMTKFSFRVLYNSTFVVGEVTNSPHVVTLKPNNNNKNSNITVTTWTVTLHNVESLKGVERPLLSFVDGSFMFSSVFNNSSHTKYLFSTVVNWSSINVMARWY